MLRCAQQLARISRSAQASMSELGAKGFATDSKYGEGDLKGTAMIPENEYERTAIIYKPGGPAGQYGYDEKAMFGGAKTPVKIWLPTQETWINPLMGWSSSSDCSETSYHKMDFDTVESAQEFLRRRGIKYVVEDAPTNWGPSYRPKAFFGYGDNFSHKKKGLPDLTYLEDRGKAKATLKKK